MSDQQPDQPEQREKGGQQADAEAPPESRAPTEETPSSAAPTERAEETHEGQETGSPGDADFTDPPVLESTGDDVVDAALEQFDRVTGEPLATHIEAAEKVQDTLQSRLSDLGDS